MTGVKRKQSLSEEPLEGKLSNCDDLPDFHFMFSAVQRYGQINFIISKIIVLNDEIQVVES